MFLAALYGIVDAQNEVSILPTITHVALRAITVRSRGNSNLECVPDRETDALPPRTREAAYTTYDKEMAEAWKNR
jgi:hypothetical protein